MAARSWTCVGGGGDGVPPKPPVEKKRQGRRDFRNVKSPVAEYIRSPRKIYNFDAGRKELNYEPSVRSSNKSFSSNNSGMHCSSISVATRNSRVPEYLRAPSKKYIVLQPENSFSAKNLGIHGSSIPVARIYRNYPVPEHLREPSKTYIILKPKNSSNPNILTMHDSSMHCIVLKPKDVGTPKLQSVDRIKDEQSQLTSEAFIRIVAFGLFLLFSLLIKFVVQFF